MTKNSKSKFYTRLEEVEPLIGEKYTYLIRMFHDSYMCVIEENVDFYDELLTNLVDLVLENIKNPFPFELYHKALRAPFDYYQFGLDFVRPLIDMEHSTVKGGIVLKEIEEKLKRGENVILLANHQTEADPQAISLMIEHQFPRLAEDMIFVAGDRVVTDPMAIPFSMGCNLFCIYSKKYIDNPPEDKVNKQLHNQKTMSEMSQKLAKGGICIYVAPSGGRDRKGKSGTVEVDPFDPSSVEMFYLMAKRAKTPTHFHTLALETFELLPPPETIQIELGEARQPKPGPVHLDFGPAIDMEAFSAENKKILRQVRATAIWQKVKDDYNKLGEL
ncbi:MAG: hypothetical protein SP1CHLAM54_01770 [Chlamydiia bacterium]|nr:hypothetical protein [Chlamydiia bacterium]MCH9615095.1 hypothetical protein [Chlamydiia bacterium]MCH9628583.1 hypothetical protein [Chlamydiia bacterium]